MPITATPLQNNALITAGYIKNIHGELNPWKLQKLNYFAEAWKLAWVGTPLFSNPIEAWKDGPVVREVYREYRYGSNLSNIDWSPLSSTDREIIKAVLDFYGNFSKQELIDISHEDDPWKNARAGLRPTDIGNRPINKSDLRRFYTRKAILDKDCPTAPSSTIHTPTIETVQEIGAAQETRWKDTLDWLSTR